MARLSAPNGSSHVAEQGPVTPIFIKEQRSGVKGVQLNTCLQPEFGAHDLPPAWASQCNSVLLTCHSKRAGVNGVLLSGVWDQ